MTSSRDGAEGLLGSVDRELALRICGTQHDGQLIRVAARKCTIGSGAGCTIRLRAPGVQPLHCLILRGSAGMVVRRWSRCTRLNGRAFTDAELHRGDRLAIGPVELEIVEGAGQPPQPPEKLNERLRQAEAALSHSQAQTVQLGEKLEQLERQRQQERARQQRREAELRKAQTRLDERAKQLDEATAQLNQQRGAFEQQRGAWENERREAEREPAERQQALEQEQDSLATNARQMGQEAEQLARQREALAHEPAQWEQQRRQRGQQFQDLLDQMERHQPPLAQLEAGHEDEPEDEKQDAATAAGPRPSGDQLVTRPIGDQPDPSGRTGPAASAPPGTTPDDSAADAETMPDQPLAKTVCLPHLARKKPEEESIEAYMVRLLKRVRGEEEPASSAGPCEAAAVEAAGPAAALPAAADRDVSADKPRPPAPTRFMPRHAPPERSSKIEALRALANQSARSAIETSDRRRWNAEVYERLLVSAVAAVIGLSLVCLSNRLLSFTVLGAVASFAAAGFWALQAARIRKRLSPVDAQPPSESASTPCADQPKAGLEEAGQGQ